MIKFKPTLIVNRLIVIKNNNYVYDQSFHVGVNIIRGKNSTGKSTIADFIFYALGGDLPKWKDEAKACDYTLIDVSINQKRFVLKREIKTSQAGMDIFEGNMDHALSVQLIAWMKFPYNATEHKDGFYKMLFKLLGIPFTKSENFQSITMHQLLRFIYVDQMTSLDRIFKTDKFDSSDKRNAIGELLLGLSTIDYYDLKSQLKKIERDLDAKIYSIRTLHSILGQDIPPSESEIDKAIANNLEEIENIKEKSYVFENEDKNKSQILTELRSELGAEEENLNSKYQKISAISYEIADSKRFIISLKSKLKSLQQSSKTISALSDIEFKYCPSCFKELNSEHHLNACHLCGGNSKDIIEEPTLKISKQIEFQIAESEKILIKNTDKITEINSRIKDHESKIRSLKAKIAVINSTINLSDSIAIEKIERVAYLSFEINNYNSLREKSINLQKMYNERDVLQQQVNDLQKDIDQKKLAHDSFYDKKRKEISDLTKAILTKDGGYEDAFKNSLRIDFDFGEDKITVDDRVLFSASSMVFLKNAFHLAFLQASCLSESYFYPRFLLMDNIEDKGMTEARSHNFQKIIVDISKNLNVEHQIIFTTSMIESSLDDTSYCIGKYYKEDEKTLNIK